MINRFPESRILQLPRAAGALNVAHSWLIFSHKSIIKICQKMVNIFECSFSLKSLSSSNNVNIRYIVQDIMKNLETHSVSGEQ